MTDLLADLLPALSPVLYAVAHTDLSDRAQAEASLAAALDDATMAALTRALTQAHATHGLTPKVATPTLSFGRLAKPSDATHGLSIDVVDMQGAGAVHTHPRGEVSWCMPLDGEPVFEGVRQGWAVMVPGSRHVPTVTGGRMLIAYFLPGGALDWT